MPSCATSALTGAATDSTSASGGGVGSIIFLVVLMVAMFAIMIIPQRRRDKKVKEMLSALKKGDRVRTIGGIYGTIQTINEEVVTLLVGPDKVKLVFARGAIAQVEEAGVENTLDAEVKE